MNCPAIMDADMDEIRKETETFGAHGFMPKSPVRRHAIKEVGTLRIA